MLEHNNIHLLNSRNLLLRIALSLQNLLGITLAPPQELFLLLLDLEVRRQTTENSCLLAPLVRLRWVVGDGLGG